MKKLRPGMHADGNGLYLVVQDSGSRSWILRTLVHGKRRDIGLGGLSTTSLSQARAEAAELRRQARKGEDPLQKRKIEMRSAAPTFEQIARDVHKDVAPSLKNEHNRVNWLRSLENHVFPILGIVPVNAVQSEDVMRAIMPIWTKKPDVARKVLARIRLIISWATRKGHRNVLVGSIALPLPNPCDGIRDVLPSQPKDGRHEALQYQDVPAFILKLREYDSTGLSVKRAMEFTILTAVRTSEALYATWDEFNLKARMWRIPAERMKMDEPHEVWLSDRCLEILEEMKDGDDKYVFPSATKNEALSNVAMLRSLQRMEGYEKMTMHGFRSAFKSWGEEKTKIRSFAIERCLAHMPQDMDKHYLRTSFPEDRRKLMKAWAAFIIEAPARVLAFQA